MKSSISCVSPTHISWTYLRHKRHKRMVIISSDWQTKQYQRSFTSGFSAKSLLLELSAYVTSSSSHSVSLSSLKFLFFLPFPVFFLWAFCFEPCLVFNVFFSLVFPGTFSFLSSFRILFGFCYFLSFLMNVFMKLLNSFIIF